MSYSITATEHNVAFPSKVNAGDGGEHILNMVIAADMDNGVIGSNGGWADFDAFTFTPGNSGFKGELHQAANGNWYVLVTEIDADNPPIFLYNSAVLEDERLRGQEKYFYNAKGEMNVKGYVLKLNDIVEESAAIFTNTPAEGKSVTVSGTKLTVGA